MYGVENRFKMLLLLGLKRPHCGMRIQQLSTTSKNSVNAGMWAQYVQKTADEHAEQDRKWAAP